jgi:hypothetical protein
MGRSVAHKLIESHLIEGDLTPGSEIAIRIDQTLTQDATATLVMLELAAMGLDRVRTELSAQYVNHNLIQADFRNPDDHLFLRSAGRRFGVWYSRAGQRREPPRAHGALRCAGRRRCSTPTATLHPPGRPGCWRSAPGASKWPRPRRASHFV